MKKTSNKKEEEKNQVIQMYKSKISDLENN